MPTIDETVALIKRAHDGQKTKSGEPYWTHPVAVMMLLPPDATIDERHAALLHDVLEDTYLTANDLVGFGYSDETIKIVRMVTRPKDEPRPSYMDWIRSISASGNRGAMKVKLADNIHNSDPDRIAALPPEERDIVKRYKRSMRVLKSALAKQT